MKNIGIIGCGWLGLPLAKSLLKEGYTVYGTTTSAQKLEVLSQAKIKAFNIALFEGNITGEIHAFLEPLDVLIINVPPRLRGALKENFVKKITLLKDAILKTKCSKIIFASSTAVYGETKGKVTEKTKVNPNTESGRQLVLSEKVFLEETSLPTVVIRFGGLIGPNRHPATILSGRKNLKNGNAPVNLIHLKDCISIIKQCIQEQWYTQNQIINAVYPLHPTKKEYYTQECIQRGIAPPVYEDTNGNDSKKVVSLVLLNTKKYSFSHNIHT